MVQDTVLSGVGEIKLLLDELYHYNYCWDATPCTLVETCQHFSVNLYEVA